MSQSLEASASETQQLQEQLTVQESTIEALRDSKVALEKEKEILTGNINSLTSELETSNNSVDHEKQALAAREEEHQRMLSVSAPMSLAVLLASLSHQRRLLGRN